MKKAKKATVVVQLNIDMIVEILSRLGVKDLIRFKSVCKSWFQLISSKDFIKLHLKRSSFRPITLENRSFNIDRHRVRTRHPETSNFCGSSCDGLVCLFSMRQSIIHIWNPALRSSACIPMRKRPPTIICFWFGLHSDEYKLVLGTPKLEMHVVRPYIDSCYDWRSTQKLRDGYCPYEEIGTLFNGNVHWSILRRQRIASNSNNMKRTYWTVLSYNLHQEKVGEIGLPVDKYLSVKHARLGEVDGCLSALFTCVLREFELWSMKEYGLKESWTKMVVLNAESSIPYHGIRLKEDVVDYPKSPLFLKVVYVESLVSPKISTERSLKSHKKSCGIIQGM